MVPVWSLWLFGFSFHHCCVCALEVGVASENTMWPEALTSHILRSRACHGNPFKESLGAP